MTMFVSGGMKRRIEIMITNSTQIEKQIGQVFNSSSAKMKQNIVGKGFNAKSKTR